MKYDVIIIGGGIVGLATAFKILEQKPTIQLLLLEKEVDIALHQTGNNSGVIHSGIYYKPGSEKAKNCTLGYKLLLDFADQYGIPYNLCGKLIVASNQNEVEELMKVYHRGIENGLNEIKLVEKHEIVNYEPHAIGFKAIWVPYTGIIDYKLVAQKMHQQILEWGGMVHVNQKVISINQHTNSNLVKTETSEFECDNIINCAGLFSDKVAAMTESKLDVRIIPFRGEYYMLKKEKSHLVKSLIYPVPNPNFPFLGVHFTNLIGGGVEAGPNAVFAFKREGYRKSDFSFSDVYNSVSWPGFRKVALKYWKIGAGEFYRSFSKKAFTKALQKLVPEIQENDLIPIQAGVRAQACERNGGLLDDFLIIENKSTIHVLNAPSPAATSSLSIGKTISELLLKRYHL
jgi:L-2-hydroxyglutarate oxidase